MTPDRDHYSIQATRIEKMDGKLDDIHDQFQVDGTVGIMAKQVERLSALIENGHKKKENGSNPSRTVLLIILALAAIIAGLLGINLPLG